MSFWLSLAFVWIFEAALLRRLRFDWIIVAIVIAGSGLCAAYLTYTTVDERNFDAAAQIFYIRTIAETLRLPDVYDCTPCGHPPLYYALGALWYKTVLASGRIPIEQGLQWLSLLLHFGFIVFGLMIFRSCIHRAATFRAAAVLLVFWPSGVINSVRVHNDALASFLIIAAVYFAAEWDKRERNRDFFAAVVASALSLLTKASGYTAASLLVLVAALRMGASGFHRGAVRRLFVAILVSAVAAVSASGFRNSQRPQNLCQKVLGHACDGRYFPTIPDTPSRFLFFDVGEFVKPRIYTAPSDPFLNQVVNSSLFGMESRGDDFDSERCRALAQFIRVLLLVMFAVCLAGVPFIRRADLRKYRVYLGAGVIMVLFLTAFRLRAPNELHADFRHIFPALVPFCLGYAVIVDRLGRYARVVYFFGIAVALLMSISSVMFFI